MIGGKLDTRNIKPLPLSKRKSFFGIDEVMVPIEEEPKPVSASINSQIQNCANKICDARSRGASVMLIYGAHLIKNGAAYLIDDFLKNDRLTHLATNGAGTIHDWEFSWLGRSSECVRSNVSSGTFGTWEETGKNINLSLLVGGIEGLGYGESLGRLIYDEKLNIPSVTDLNKLIKDCPNDELTGARVELLHSLNNGYSEEGVYELQHNWKKASVLASAYKHKIPLTVHPGIGYDIISNHPMFNGASIGRSAQVDFQKFASSVDGLDGGVVLSVGSAIMGPQVFEKAISFVNHLRISEGKGIVNDHSLFVVDLQDGGDWDWSKGEPPITNPAYYLRFCKSYSRMGGEMNYLQCDNITFMQHLRLALMKN